MKKFLIGLAIFIIAFLSTSCRPEVNGFVYDVNIDGNASGNVLVTFPNGSLDLDGSTTLAFKYSNDTTIVKYVGDTKLVKGLVDPNVNANKEVQKFNTTVNNSFNVVLNDTDLGGSYYIRIHGYAKEPNTGIVIAIDKTFQYPPVAEKIKE